MDEYGNQTSSDGLIKPKNRLLVGRVLIAAALAVVIIAVIIWLVFFRGSSTNDTSKTATHSTSQTTKVPKPAKAPSGSSKPNDSTASNSTPQTAPAPTQAATNNGTSDLADTGPSGVIALFFGVALLATLAHHLVGRRFGTSRQQ